MNDGGNSTLVFNGVTYTAAGGKSGQYAENNSPFLYNIPGSTSAIAGTSAPGGVTPILGTKGTSNGSRNGSRGGGGWTASSGTSGAGGDGVFRWELTLGSGK